jgi:hypothetical protein
MLKNDIKMSRPITQWIIDQAQKKARNYSLITVKWHLKIAAILPLSDLAPIK